LGLSPIAPSLAFSTLTDHLVPHLAGITALQRQSTGIKAGSPVSASS